MDYVWIVGIILAVVVVALILRAAFRGMRPQPPEAQVYVPAPTMPRASGASGAPTTVAGVTPAVTAEIDRLVGSGQKIQAIKLLRQHTGLSLKDAKDRIEHWSVSTTAAHTAAVSNATAVHSSITPTAATPTTVRSSLPASVSSEIDRLVAGDQKIVAIKLLREHTGLGLKQSKELIEAWVPYASR